MVLFAFLIGLLLFIIAIVILYALRPHVFSHTWQCGMGSRESCQWLRDLLNCANCDAEACARINYAIPPKCRKKQGVIPLQSRQQRLV